MKSIYTVDTLDWSRSFRGPRYEPHAQSRRDMVTLAAEGTSREHDLGMSSFIAYPAFVASFGSWPVWSYLMLQYRIKDRCS